MKLIYSLYLLLLVAGCSTVVPSHNDTTIPEYCKKYTTTKGSLFECKTISDKNFHNIVAKLTYTELTSAYFESFSYYVGFYSVATKSLLLYQIDFTNNTLVLASFFNTGEDYLLMVSSPIPANLSLKLLQETNYMAISYTNLVQGSISLPDFVAFLHNLKHTTGFLDD